MQGLREAVTCAVCSEVYQSGIREPLALPCGHSFCRMCLDAVKRTGNFLCPNCRQTHNNVKMEQLSVNYALLSVSSACPDVEFDTCGDHGDDQKYWCCNCEMPLCSLCLYSGHPLRHSVKLSKAYIQEKRMALKGKFDSCDEKMEKRMEEVKNKFAKLLQGVQGLSETSSDIHDTWLNMISILDQIKKANNIECIRSSEKCVEQFLADFTKDNMVGKEERTSEAAGLGGNTSNAGANAAKKDQNQPLPKLEGAVQKCQLAFQDGRLVLHCFGSPTDNQLSLKMPSEVFLELSVGGKCLGRVYIHLWTNLRRAQQFLTLCMGTLGPSYRGVKSSEVRNKSQPGEHMLFPHHKVSGTANAQPIFTNLDSENNYATNAVEGLVGQFDNTSGFVICTIGSPALKWARPFSKVFSGLDVVKAAVRLPPNSITISNCGLVLPHSLI